METNRDNNDSRFEQAPINPRNENKLLGDDNAQGEGGEDDAAVFIGGSGEAPSPEAPEESPVLPFEYGTSKNQSRISIEVAPEE
jgi:hypothetical protein